MAKGAAHGVGERQKGEGSVLAVWSPDRLSGKAGNNRRLMGAGSRSTSQQGPGV